MALTRIWPVKSGLGRAISYAADREKTSAEVFSEERYQALSDALDLSKEKEIPGHRIYVQGINCNATCALDQFITVKEQFQKTDGNLAYHGYIAFKPGEVTPETAQRIGEEFVRRVWGGRFQAVVTTHLNTEHLHCHFVINSVSFLDGKRLQSDERYWFRFRRVADEICRSYGLSVVQDPDLNSDPDFIKTKEQAGVPTRQSILRETIDGIIPHCRNMDDFIFQLKKKGYRYGLNPSRRYWTVTPPGTEQTVRLYRLGEEYTHDRIRERIGENFRAGNYTPAEDPGYHRQYRLRTREHKLYEKTNLYRKYLYYCYKLGYLPKGQNRRPTKAHPLLRDDLLWLEKISQEVRLLGEHQIDTAEQLAAYAEECAGRLVRLEAERAQLRIEIRRVMPEEQRESIREKRSAVTAEMMKIRKEIALCRSVSQRSEVFSPKLEKIFEEERRMNGRLRVRDPR